MKILMVLGSIILPILMLYFESLYSKLRNVYNILIVISLLVLGNITALSVYQVIIDQEVFMTTIHGIFLNPFFLITGAYLGGYTIYRLMSLTISEW